MTDLELLQGTWYVTALEMEGQAMPAPPEARVVVTGERFESLGMGAEYTGRVELDAGSTPKALDMIFDSGPEVGNRSLGIYELSGDSWRLCLTVTGSTRPCEFAAPPGSGLALETLSRQAVAAAVEEAGPELVEAASAPEFEGEWQMLTCIANGVTVPSTMVKTGRRVAANGLTESWFGKQRILKARYSLDGGAIDYRLDNGQQQFGIWKLEGAVLHIAFGTPGQPRPTEFAAGVGRTLTSWQRK